MNGERPTASLMLPSRFYEQAQFPESVTGAVVEIDSGSVFFDKLTGTYGLTFNWNITCSDHDSEVCFRVCYVVLDAILVYSCPLIYGRQPTRSTSLYARSILSPKLERPGLAP